MALRHFLATEHCKNSFLLEKSSRVVVATFIELEFCVRGHYHHSRTFLLTQNEIMKLNCKSECFWLKHQYILPPSRVARVALASIQIASIQRRSNQLWSFMQSREVKWRINSTSYWHNREFHAWYHPAGSCELIGSELRFALTNFMFATLINMQSPDDNER